MRAEVQGIPFNLPNYCVLHIVSDLTFRLIARPITRVPTWLSGPDNVDNPRACTFLSFLQRPSFWSCRACSNPVYHLMATSMAGSNEYNGEQLVVVAVAFLALTYLSVILRCFVRISITKAFAADDWLILAAQVRLSLSLTQNDADTSAGQLYTVMFFHPSRSTLWTRKTQ